jgi:hypothetical protein
MVRAIVVIAAIAQAAALPTTGKEHEVSMIADDLLLDAEGCKKAGDCKPWCSIHNKGWSHKCTKSTFHCCWACPQCAAPTTPPPSPPPGTPPPVYSHDATASWLSLPDAEGSGRLLASRATKISPSGCSLGGEWISSGNILQGQLASYAESDGTGDYYCVTTAQDGVVKMVKFNIVIDDGAAYAKMISAGYAGLNEYTGMDSIDVLYSSLSGSAANVELASSLVKGHYGIASLTYTYATNHYVSSSDAISAVDPGTLLTSSTNANTEMRPTACTLGGSHIYTSDLAGEIIPGAVDSDGTGTYYCAAIDSKWYMRIVEFTVKGDSHGDVYAESVDAGWKDASTLTLDDVPSEFASAQKQTVASSKSDCCYAITELAYTAV